MGSLIRRPLQDRQMTGSFFGEDAVFISVTQTRNDRGQTTRTGVRTPVRLATTPMSPNDPRVALLTQGGTRIEDLREFFTAFEIDVKNRDQIVYGGETYTIISTGRYPSHNVSIGQRDDTQ